MNILVLGCTGFLGGHVARAGYERGWQVRGLRRDPAARGNVPEIPIDWVEGDLNDPHSLTAAMEGMDFVFHVAGYYPQARQGLSIEEHLSRARQEIHHVLEAAHTAGISRLVYTSSLSTIGQPPPGQARLADERDVYRPGSLPRNAYYEVKITMEQVILESKDLPVVIVNPTVVIGPGDVHNSSTRFLRYIRRGQVPIYLPVVVNLIDVRDMAIAQLAAAEKGHPGGRYILGGLNLSLLAALSAAAEVCGVRPPWIKIPLAALDPLIWIERLAPALRISSHLKAIRTWQGYDISKAERELNLTTRPVLESFQDTLDWMNLAEA